MGVTIQLLVAAGWLTKQNFSPLEAAKLMRKKRSIGNNETEAIEFANKVSLKTQQKEKHMKWCFPIIC